MAKPPPPSGPAGPNDPCIRKTTIPIAWVSVSGFYDRPLSGWLRARGRYWFFQIENEDDPTETYSVWDMPKALRIPLLQRVRKWRHMVGWHMERDPTNPGARVSFNAAARPNWRDFYDLPKPPCPSLKPEWRIGTTDLRTITLEHAHATAG